MIDINKIKNIVRKNHNIFIKNYGSNLEKIIADDKLKCEMVASKLKFILNVFIKEDIICNIEENVLGPHRKIKIFAKNNNYYLEICTNGDKIVVTGENFEIINGFLPKEPCLFFDNVLDNNFDWYEFAEMLLEKIHIIIYGKKQASIIKVDNIFKK